ncbi:hypothetical protein B0H14DRAFT_2648129 [Mycena olivaceomarginata]|nr:hypothetical protein B0H14DRAFT_2648129 [Mycena olivaceomarginata]
MKNLQSLYPFRSPPSSKWLCGSSLLIASQMWDGKQRRRGKYTGDAMARGIHSVGGSNMSTFEVAGCWALVWMPLLSTESSRLTLPACDEVWFNDRALFSLQTVTHWVGGASGTSRGLMVVEERNVLFVSFRNPGDQTKLFPHAHPEFSIKLTNFPIPKRSNEVTKMGTTQSQGNCWTPNLLGMRVRVRQCSPYRPIGATSMLHDCTTPHARLKEELFGPPYF